MTPITELITAFTTVAAVVIAIRALIADAAFSKFGVYGAYSYQLKVGYQMYLREGSNTQLNASPATAETIDHFTI